MKSKPFDWDKYFSKAKYKEIADSSPDLRSRRHPTVYSPDGKWIYLSSLDIDVEIHDLDELKIILKHLINSYKSEIAQEIKSSINHLRLWRIRVDCIEICGLIRNLVEDHENYYDPDSLLNT